MAHWWSWLFDFGIINFSFGHSKYDNGGQKDNYSVGTFLPLSACDVDIDKFKWTNYFVVRYYKPDINNLPKKSVVRIA